MKIRWRLLKLMLLIALVPLIFATVFERAMMHGLTRRLASRTRKSLTEDARNLLENIVRDYGRIAERDRESIELGLKIQAREVERRLAMEAPASPVLYFSEDYDKGSGLPEGMVDSEKHFRAGPDGKRTPVPVTYDEQVYFVVKGAEGETVNDDMARLSTMPEVYSFANKEGLMYWQYTSLESGFHSCYPGHGGYPSEYDPRKRAWYQEARNSNELTWVIMPEVSTRTIAPTVAMPVRRPNGDFAGVTAIDVDLTGMFKSLNLPPQWSRGAEIVFVVPAWPESPAPGKPIIIAHRSYRTPVRDWEKEFQLMFLESDDPEELDALMADALSGKSGVRKMRYRGKDALWAYGTGKGIPVVIVPYDTIVARASEIEQSLLEQISRTLKVTGLIFLLVIIVAVHMAFRHSRKVTEPVRQLAERSVSLAAGDFQTRLDIKTGDEFQDLSELVNKIGPELAERDKMKRALELAQEIQQHLLPQSPPKPAGFDIAGKSVYCDETGGDYYDFIELITVGPGKLGIAVGDVTGHGISAALLMASARAVLRTRAELHGTDLGALFEALNMHLVRDGSEGRFMTLFYGILDTDARSLVWTSAGHDPPFWLQRASGRIEELPGADPPLGIIEEMTFSQVGPVTIERGDVVVIGTDGIWEAESATEEQFGKGRLREVLSCCNEMSAEQIRNAIVEAVGDFSRPIPQRDDITLVVIKAL